MSPKIKTVSPFSVTGIAVRTINRDEFTPTTAKLPTLWGTFFGQGVAARIPGQVPNSSIFGVYADYESDASNFYTVTAGVATVGSDSPEFATVQVKAGEYLVFENKGTMPQAVIDTWVQIWEFFENNSEFVRRFETDFEEYLGVDEIAVYIGVERT